MYEQTDVSMGGSLGPVLANIITIESEKVDCSSATLERKLLNSI